MKTTKTHLFLLRALLHQMQRNSWQKYEILTTGRKGEWRDAQTWCCRGVNCCNVSVRTIWYGYNLTHQLYLQEFISQSHTRVTGCSLSLTVDICSNLRAHQEWHGGKGRKGDRWEPGKGHKRYNMCVGVSGTQMVSSSHLHPCRHNCAWEHKAHFWKESKH